VLLSRSVRIAVIAGKTIKDTVDSRGDWKVMLEPLPAGGPYELVVSGRDTITIEMCFFGEVWPM
jgi:sialate O-acetylesterase